VRSLVWKVEGSGIDVFVVPTLTQRAGHDIRPVAGLPLVYVDRTGYSGLRRTMAANDDSRRTAWRASQSALASSNACKDPSRL
jgi:hypothetical protein